MEVTNCVFHGNAKDIGLKGSGTLQKFTIENCWFEKVLPSDDYVSAGNFNSVGTTASHTCKLLTFQDNCATPTASPRATRSPSNSRSATPSRVLSVSISFFASSPLLVSFPFPQTPDSGLESPGFGFSRGHLPITKDQGLSSLFSSSFRLGQTVLSLASVGFPKSSLFLNSFLSDSLLNWFRYSPSWRSSSPFPASNELWRLQERPKTVDRLIRAAFFIGNRPSPIQ
jgi:hypothetical protein